MANLQSTSIPNITVEQNLNVDGILNSTGIGIYGFKSDGGSANTTSGPIQWNGIRQNSGITTSNSTSRFTVPQDGYYFVSFRNIGSNRGTTSRTWIQVNGSTSGRVRAYGRAGSHDYPMTLAFSIYQLSEGDYIEYNKDSNEMYQRGSDYTQFSIFKIA